MARRGPGRPSEPRRSSLAEERGSARGLFFFPELELPESALGLSGRRIDREMELTFTPKQPRFGTTQTVQRRVSREHGRKCLRSYQ